jgi:hypothetical protein
MRLFAICAILFCGCSKVSQHASTVPSPQGSCIFDEALKNPNHSNSILVAERQLPTDVWEQKPFHVNASQGQRVSAVGERILAEVEPRFKMMSVSNLVFSAKLVSYPFGDVTNDFGAVAEYVYVFGNQLIINEIKTRPPEEVRTLRKLRSDQLMFFEGPQGFGLPLTYQLEEVLGDLGLTSQ